MALGPFGGVPAAHAIPRALTLTMSLQGPWVSSPTTCHWRPACSPPSVCASTPTGTWLSRATPGTEPNGDRVPALSPTQRPEPALLGWGGGASGTGGSPGYSWPSEPGYYRDGEFGIRIEDVALVVEAQTEVGQWGWGDSGGRWEPASSQRWRQLQRVRGHSVTPFCGSTRARRPF